MSSITTNQSTTPPHPSTHTITRQEIKYYIQLYITAVIRQTLLHEEMEKMQQDVHNTESLLDLIQINKTVNKKMKRHRSFIKRQAFFFEHILYKRATTMEEYYNLEDLDRRLDEVGRILNERRRRALREDAFNGAR